MASNFLMCACLSDMCFVGWQSVGEVRLFLKLHCCCCQVLSGSAGWMMSDRRFWSIICWWSSDVCFWNFIGAPLSEVRRLFLKLHHWFTFDKVRRLFLKLHHWLWSIRYLFLRWATCGFWPIRCVWSRSPLALISQRVCHNCLVPGFTDDAGFLFCDDVVKTENLDWIFLLDVSLLLRLACGRISIVEYVRWIDLFDLLVSWLLR